MFTIRPNMAACDGRRWFAKEGAEMIGVKKWMMVGAMVAAASLSASEVTLHEAAANGQKEIVEQRLKQGDDVNKEGKRNNTPLHRAARNGRLKVVKLLLKQKDINVNAKNVDQDTPLHMAARGSFRENKKATEHYAKVVELLLKKGANPNSRSNREYTPLHEASGDGSLKAVLILLGRGANPSAKNKYRQTPEELAEARGQLQKVTLAFRLYDTLGRDCVSVIASYL